MYTDDLKLQGASVLGAHYQCQHGKGCLNESLAQEKDLVTQLMSTPGSSVPWGGGATTPVWLHQLHCPNFALSPSHIYIYMHPITQTRRLQQLAIKVFVRPRLLGDLRMSSSW